MLLFRIHRWKLTWNLRMKVWFRWFSSSKGDFQVPCWFFRVQILCQRWLITVFFIIQRCVNRHGLFRHGMLGMWEGSVHRSECSCIATWGCWGSGGSMMSLLGMYPRIMLQGLCEPAACFLQALHIQSYLLRWTVFDSGGVWMSRVFPKIAVKPPKSSILIDF